MTKTYRTRIRKNPLPVKTPAQRGAHSRRRGATAERELADVIRSYGYPAMRGQQRSGLEQADVVGGPEGWHFESKRTEALNVWKAFEQAQRDRRPGEVAVVATRRDRSPWLAVVELDTLLRLIKAAGGGPLAGSPVDERAAAPVAPPPARSRRVRAARGEFDDGCDLFEGLPPA